jgi:hypothetical protein
MRRPFVLNARLNDLYKSEQNKYMANKLENARPLVNVKCPESYIFYKNQFHKKGTNESLGM